MSPGVMLTACVCVEDGGLYKEAVGSVAGGTAWGRVAMDAEGAPISLKWVKRIFP